ncbi:MAG: hypothetical protein AAF771_06260 [Pseudomonadota bacterium]
MSSATTATQTATQIIAAAFPDQQGIILQDLVYKNVFFAPGIDRANWIATLETLRDGPVGATLLVGDGLPTTRGDWAPRLPISAFSTMP